MFPPLRVNSVEQVNWLRVKGSALRKAVSPNAVFKSERNIYSSSEITELPFPPVPTFCTVVLFPFPFSSFLLKTCGPDVLSFLTLSKVFQPLF